MRPYRLVDETLDDDEDDAYPRVVPVSASGRSRLSGGAPGRHEAWTPRGTGTPAAPPREAAPPPSIDPGLTRTHRWMLFGFLIVCAGMVLGMVMVRVWDEASRAVAALPPEGAQITTRPAGQSAPPPVATAAPVETAPPAPSAGAVTTEIRVLQPNYTVAPGETLGIIARRHGTSVEALASINNLENRNSLAVGQKLIIP